MLSKNQVKYIQSLGDKKCRDEEAVFIAEGTKIISELLSDKNCVIKQLYAVKDWISSNRAEVNCDITEITTEELGRISQLKTPNKVLAVAEKIKWIAEPKIKKEISLALETIQDPGNMGTIIRLADWFGIKQIFCSTDCADLYNPKVVQASMGSVIRVRTIYTDLEKFLNNNKTISTYAAVLDGEDVTKLGKIKEGILLIGNESRGISEALLKNVKNRITIPRKGNAESLNAAIAAGIILSHLAE